MRTEYAKYPKYLTKFVRRKASLPEPGAKLLFAVPTQWAVLRLFGLSQRGVPETSADRPLAPCSA